MTLNCAQRLRHGALKREWGRPLIINGGMMNEGMQEIAKMEEIQKVVQQVSQHVGNLQWELDRMGTDGKSEYLKLSIQTKKLEKLCK